MPASIKNSNEDEPWSEMDLFDLKTSPDGADLVHPLAAQAIDALTSAHQTDQPRASQSPKQV